MNDERDFLAENWEAILQRSAERATRRAVVERRWRERLNAINRATLATGAYLVVQFPVAAFYLQTLQREAFNFGLTLR